jgi:hypothetical protein
VHESGSHSKIWLARAVDEGVCLISSVQTDTSNSFALACADPAQFEASGVELVDGLTQVDWDGKTLNVSISASLTG